MLLIAGSKDEGALEVWSSLQGPYDGSSDGQLLPPDSSVSARTSNGKVVSGRSCLPYGISASGRVPGYDCYVAPKFVGLRVVYSSDASRL